MKTLFSFSAAVLGAVASAQTYGNTSSFETQSGHAPDYVLGVRVTVSSTMVLDSFGMMYGQTGLTPVTANGKFALYDANGSGGSALNLVASTGAVSLSGIATFNNIAFTTNPTITAGTYWMMALYESNATPRMGLAGQGTSLINYWSQTYASGFNATSPGVLSYSGQNFNYWINGHAPVPEPASFAVIGLGLVAFAVRRRRVH